MQLIKKGTILREVMAAADLLREDFKVNADISTATSFNELRRDGMSAERWSALHPSSRGGRATSKRRSKATPGQSWPRADYMRSFADRVRSPLPRRYVVLGTNLASVAGDYRVKLRKFREVNRPYVAVAALKSLQRTTARSSLRSSTRRSRSTDSIPSDPIPGQCDRPHTKNTQGVLNGGDMGGNSQRVEEVPDIGDF